MKAICSQIVFFVIYALICLVSLLPLPVLYGLSRVLVVLPMKIAGYRRTVVIANLARSFPERSYSEIQQIVKEFYRYLGRVVAETVWLSTASQKSVMKRFSLKDCHVLESLRKQGKSVVVMLSHMGNWEFLRVFSCPLQENVCGYNLQQVHVIYQRINSLLFDKLMYSFRKRYPYCHLIESRNVARYMAKHQDIPGIYFMISDQCPGPIGKSIAVRFLEQPTLMIEGPEALARKFGFAVVYGVIRQAGKGRYGMHFTLISDNAAAEEEGVVTRQFARLLEQDIRSDSPHWLWSHKRWKRTPCDKA